MSKKNIKHSNRIDQSTLLHVQKEPERVNFWTNKKMHLFLIALLSFLLYANTLSHDYAQDDAIVITQNMHTVKGIAGIPNILGKDTFHGFFKETTNYVSGGRYRPFTLILFAIEYQLFGASPFVGHLVNVILFSLTCLMLYLLILKLFNKNNVEIYLTALATALLFAVHPIHTEAVANIKGRDEIVALLAALSGLYYCLKALDQQQSKYWIMAVLSFFIGLMSKENVITFLAIVPVALVLFRNTGLTDSIKHTLPIVIASFVFVVVRTLVIGFDMGSTSQELMNNPYMKIVGNSYVPFTDSERMATIFYTLLKYLQLLVAPISLTHDYYPHHISLMTWSSWKSILGLLLYLGLAAWTLRLLWRRDVLAFGLVFYLASLSIVSNVVFPIGTHMAERFMFMPSVGVLYCAVVLFVRLMNRINNTNHLETKNLSFAMMALILVSSVYSIKTVFRNFAWKDNLTLFETDIKTSVNSAKLNTGIGGVLGDEAIKPEKASQKIQLLERSIPYLRKAIELHPTYKTSYQLIGRNSIYMEKYEQAIEAYQQAIQIDGNDESSQQGLAISYREYGKYWGEKKQNLGKAIEYLNKAYQMNAKDYETVRLLGVANGNAQNHDEAIKYFTKAATLLGEQDNKAKASILFQLYIAYNSKNDAINAEKNLQQALALDPDVAKQK